MPEATTIKTPRRWLRRLILSLVAISLLLVIGVGILLLLSQKRLDEAVEGIDDADRVLNPDAMAPPRPPDHENAALLLAPILEGVSEPSFEAKMLIGAGVLDEEVGDIAALPELVTWIEANQHWIPRLEEALARPDMQFERDLSLGWFPSKLDVPGFQRLAFLLQAVVWHRLEAGDPGGALRVAALGVRLGTAMRRYPAMLDSLVGTGIQEAAIRCAQASFATVPVMGANKLDDSSRQAVAAALRDADQALDAASVLRFNRAIVHRGFENLRTGKPVHEGIDRGGALRGTPLADLLSGWLFRFDQARFLRRATTAIELAPHPYGARREAWTAWEAQERDVPWYALLSRMNLVIWPRLAIALDRADTNLAMARLAMRVEQHVAEHGAAPASLADLGITAPLDRLGTGPVTYRVLPDGGYTIYSVGRDGLDDGGKDAEDLDSGGDLVWTRGG